MLRVARRLVFEPIREHLDDWLDEVSDAAVVRIIDNGPGMDKELLNNIFVPFYTTKETGSGIGLPLSRQIMRAHKGNIKVHSTPGEGTSFELHFRF